MVMTAGVTSYLEVVTTIVGEIFSNSNLMIFVGATVAGMALGFVKRLIGRM